MTRMNRREFIQASAASLLLDCVKVPASPGGPGKINETARLQYHRTDQVQVRCFGLSLGW
jgi:hypothetical protein